MLYCDMWKVLQFLIAKSFERSTYGGIGLERTGDRFVLLLCLIVVVIVSFGEHAPGQIIGLSLTPEYQLSNDIRVNEADGAVRTRLAEIEEAIKGRHWDEVVAGIREVVTKAGDDLVNVTARLNGVPPRYIPVREYCQLLLTQLPQEGLEKYRQLVDPNCRLWLEKGLQSEDESLLRRICDTELASNYADMALWYLGEWSLQAGLPDQAEFFWRQLLPVDRRSGDLFTWRSVATCRYSAAAVRARLILATILAGRLSQARRELAEFATVHSGERGRMAGREADLTATLTGLLADAEHWPQPPGVKSWTTFAQNGRRLPQIDKEFDIIGIAWRATLPPLPRAVITQWSEAPSARLLAENQRPLAFFPVIAKNAVFIARLDRIYGFNLENGQPLWGLKAPEVFSASSDDREQLIPVNTIGARRTTITVDRDELFARLGSPVTIQPALLPDAVRQKNVLVALDLDQEGKLLWSRDPPEEGWAFEGAPLVVEDNVYAVLRRADVPSHIYLACLDRETGDRRWLRFICAADTPGRSMLYEMTHLLPTVAQDTVFLTTNAGAVAAISRETGAIRWITCYPRIQRGDLSVWEPFRYREPNPAVYCNGELYVAPTDTTNVLGIDAFTGTILWSTGSDGERIEYLIGVLNDHLIAAGDRVYWIALHGPQAGRIVARWPMGAEYLGHGRGIIAGGSVYWPTRDAIYVIDGHTAEPKRVIPLSPWHVEGGNLVSSEGYLLVASSREIVAFRTAPISVSALGTDASARRSK